MYFKFTFFIAIVTTFFSCQNQTLYDDHIDLPDKLWKEESRLVFPVQIQNYQDSTDVYYNVRYSADYPFCNLYVKYTLLDSLGKKVIASDLHELHLADCKTGEPYGSGLGDIYDQKILALSGKIFPYSGKYKFVVQQYMRQDPLHELIAFGVSVEKSN